jgi:hypothetical protein
LGVVGGALAPTPAAAQKMSEDGMQLPWFHSRAEKLARQACENDLPECRDSIRKKIATEKMITRTAPWVLLCLFLLGMSRYSRMRENRRRKKQEEIARHHVRSSVREAKDKTRAAETEAVDDDSIDDGFGMGTPKGRH